MPRPPFVSLDVEEGGTGAGTRIRVGIRLLGRPVTYRAVVGEPEPGRVLAETNDNGYVTTFTVDPEADGRHARVTISTETGRAGMLGALEKWLLARLLLPVYVRELELLAAVAAERPGEA
ncbi:MAG TPA: SRPBCC family protein [Longimicrobiaceae bacterium]